MVKKPKTPTNEEIWVSLRTLADEIMVDDPDRVFLKDGLSMKEDGYGNEWKIQFAKETTPRFHCAAHWPRFTTVGGPDARTHAHTQCRSTADRAR